jgi:AcrR family transcriptional regulator
MKRQNAKYETTREKARNHILESAYAVISVTPFSALTMMSFADAAKISRQTLYKYFGTIDSIIFALKAKLSQEFTEIYDPIFADNSLDAKSKLLTITKQTLSLADSSPDRFVFIARFSNNPTPEETALFKSDLAAGSGRFAELIRKGQSEGSINGSLDPDITGFSILNITIGAATRIAVHRPAITLNNKELTAKDIEDTLLHEIELLLSL